MTASFSDAVRPLYDVCPANHAFGLLEYAAARLAVSWLTTHCHGDATPVLSYLAQYVDPSRGQEFLELASRIEPTDWKTMKTEALPDSGAFAWPDDAPLASELAFLRERGWFGRWLHVDMRAEPDDLLRARTWLERFVERPLNVDESGAGG